MFVVPQEAAEALGATAPARSPVSTSVVLARRTVITRLDDRADLTRVKRSGQVGMLSSKEPRQLV